MKSKIIYSSKKIEVQSSPIEGKGVFAAGNIEKGERIAIIQGPVCFNENKTIHDVLAHPDWICFKEHYWVDPTCPCKYLNHSCAPNAGIRGRRLLYAIKPIKKGEEICFDYSSTEVELRWVAPWTCHCKSKDCRKKITSIQRLPKQKVESYIPFIPTGVQYYYERWRKNKSR